MKATKNIIWRILIFYVGAIFVIVTIYPWNKIGTLGSPFVLTFSRIGITAAAGIVNFVVLTAAMSGCNSGIYSCGRMLYTLSKNGQAPKFLGKLNKDGVPANDTKATLVCLLIGVILNYIYPNSKLFVYIYSASVFKGMVPWIVLCISQIKFRKEHADEMAVHPFKSKFFPYANYIVVGYLCLVLIGMCINDATQMSLLIGALFCIIVTIGYFAFGIYKGNNVKGEEFQDEKLLGEER